MAFALPVALDREAALFLRAMRGLILSISMVWLVACGGATPSSDPVVGGLSVEPAPSGTAAPTSSVPTAGTPATASAVPRGPAALPISIDGTKLRCPEDRCRGEVDFRGQIRFQKIDPETIARWGQEPDRGLVDRGEKFSSERYELPAPSLEEVFATRDVDQLLLKDDGLAVLSSTPPDVPGASVRLELRFPDRVVARGEVKLSDRSIRLTFGDWMQGITKGPLSLPGEAAYSGPPRAMWVEFPSGVRGNARSPAELDWVLVFDDVPRKIDCERRKHGSTERATFTIEDVRGRVYERRTGIVVGEKKLPDPGAPSCSDFFQWRDENVGGVLGMRDKAAFVQIADWAWGTLRSR